MKRFYCVILAMLAVVLYAIVMSGCRAISSNVEVATQPVVETPLAEHIGKVRQGPFVNDAEEFVRNISVLLEEKSPHDYSVRRIEEILLNNGYLEEYFKGNTEPLALYCFEYIINHESLCYVSDNQNVSFSGNDKAIAICLRRCITAAVFSWSLANISITAKQLSVVFVSYRVLL